MSFSLKNLPVRWIIFLFRKLSHVCFHSILLTVHAPIVMDWDMSLLSMQTWYLMTIFPFWKVAFCHLPILLCTIAGLAGRFEHFVKKITFRSISVWQKCRKIKRIYC